MKFHWVLTAVIILAMGSCVSTKSNSNMNTESPTDYVITGKYWELAELEGKEIKNETEDSKTIGLELKEDENKVTGFAGCNNFMGLYVVDSETDIKFSELASTRMACPDSDFDENKFLEVLKSVETFETAEDGLELKNKDGDTVARFVEGEKEENDSEITEKYWKLKTLDGEKVEMVENQSKEISFTLKNEENRVTGFSGCNTFSGVYSLLEKNEISFSQMASTMRACPDVDLDETKVLMVFERTNSYKVGDDKLSLKDEDGKTLATFEAVYF